MSPQFPARKRKVSKKSGYCKKCRTTHIPGQKHCTVCDKVCWGVICKSCRGKKDKDKE